MKPIPLSVSIGVGVFVGLACAPMNNGYHEVTQTDVDAFIAKKADTRLDKARAEAWRDAVWQVQTSHPKKPFEFPNGEIADPEMWSWYEHAVLWRMHPVTSWIDAVHESDQFTLGGQTWTYVTSATGTISPVSVVGTNDGATCWLPPGVYR